MARVAPLVPSIRSGVRPATVVLLAAPLLGLAVAVPPHGSHDLWSYAMYGRMVSHYHASPYRHIPAEYAGDPMRHLVTWTHTKSVYGPVFTAVSAVLMTVAGGSTLLARLAFQGTAALALVAIVGMLWRREVSPVALALLVLNPVVVIGIVNGGHNDLLVGGLALAAVYRLQQQRPVVAGALLASAGLIKVSALLAAARRPGLGVAAMGTQGRAGPGGDHRRHGHGRLRPRRRVRRRGAPDVGHRPVEPCLDLAVGVAGGTSPSLCRACRSSSSPWSCSWSGAAGASTRRRPS